MKFIYGLLAATIFTSISQAQTITGAGATFPAPVYSKWAEASKKDGFSVNYQSVGSGAGQTQIINRTVDFGASDAPLDKNRLDANKLIQVPSVMGSITIVVNIPGVPSDKLNLSGAIIVDIFKGVINKWNHPSIAADNPGLTLPNIAISPIYRADGSGTTHVFTSWLATQSQEWKDIGTSVKWSAGMGARGNEGISAFVKRVSGSIGYVESAYVKANGLTSVNLKTSTGKWVSANPDSFIAAASKTEWTENNESRGLNTNCDTCYPILSATYVLIPRDGKNKNSVEKWLKWAYDNGDEIASSLHYVPLPREVKDRVIKTLNTD